MYSIVFIIKRCFVLQRKRHCPENSSCSLILELMLEQKATATWLCAGAAQGAHSTALLSVTQADMTQAVLAISNHRNGSGIGSGMRGTKNRDKVRATVAFGSRSVSTDASSPSSTSKNSSSCSRQILFVKLDGPSATAVDDVAQV